jgi:hypothetical protein
MNSQRDRRGSPDAREAYPGIRAEALRRRSCARAKQKTRNRRFTLGSASIGLILASPACAGLAQRSLSPGAFDPGGRHPHNANALAAQPRRKGNGNIHRAPTY